MAKQIKKKFIADDAIDGAKILLEQDQGLRRLLEDGSEEDVIVKLQSDIDAQGVALTSGLSSASSDRAAIRSEFAAADSTLQGNINAEQAAREAAITEQATLRAAAVQELRDDIDAEATAREDADAGLQLNIEAEATARIAGDADLQSKLDVEIVRARSSEQDLDLRIESLEGQVGEDLQTAIATLEAADSTLQDNINAEASARQSADTTLQSNIDAEKARIDAILSASEADKDSFAEIVALINDVDTENDQVFAGYVLSNDARVSTLESEMDAVESGLAQEILDRTGGDDALDARLSPIEGMLEYKHSSVDQNVQPVYADAEKGKEDPSILRRDGWYFTNEVENQKINWYFHYQDGISPDITLGDFSAYAVMTFDDASESPIIGVYTPATGSNDAAAWYHSRSVYSGLSSTPVVGKKYLVYFGQEPEIHPELPRLELSKSTISSAGDQDPSEVVGFASFGSDSSASVGSVKFMVESLGVNSPEHKTNVKLKIHYATQDEFDALQAQVNDLDTGFVSEAELTQAVSDLQAEIDADVLVEKTRAESEEARIEAKLDQEILDRGTLEGEFDAYVVSNDAALAQEVSDRQTLEDEFDAYVVSNDAALAQEVSARQTLEDEFDAYVVSNDAALADEANTRELADNALQSQIEGEASIRETADTELQNEIASQVTNLSNADITLQSNIDAEESARIAADSALQLAIDDEAAARTAADSTLQGNIDAETAARIAAVSAEEARALAAESALSTRIDDMISNVDPAAIDSFTEVVAAYQAADGNLQTSITNLSTAASSDRAAIRSEFAAADSTLQGNINAEESARIAADDELQSQIDNINTAVSGVVQFAKESFTVTQTDIDNGYIDLAFEAKSNSIVMFVDRLAMHEGAAGSVCDYSVSVVGGVTRITFESEMVTPAVEALEAGQVIRVTYAK